MSDRVEIAQVLATMQGESSFAGYPCWLLRLAGCPLECAWCDTAWAREPACGEPRELDALVAGARDAGLHHVLVTGGEPLAQPAARALLARLCDAGLRVVLETSGALPTDAVDRRVKVVLDVKCPGSGMADRTCWPNLERLHPGDEVKLVLADRADYDYALEVIATYHLLDRAVVALSPALGLLEPETLAAWMLRDRLHARLGLQLHRLGWPGLG
jgi:7-carboxy-7-deazaguanine synthase